MVTLTMCDRCGVHLDQVLRAGHTRLCRGCAKEYLLEEGKLQVTGFEESGDPHVFSRRLVRPITITGLTPEEREALPSAGDLQIQIVGFVDLRGLPPEVERETEEVAHFLGLQVR